MPRIAIAQDLGGDPAEHAGEGHRHPALVGLEYLADPVSDQDADEIEQDPLAAGQQLLGGDPDHGADDEQLGDRRHRPVSLNKHRRHQTP